MLLSCSSPLFFHLFCSVVFLVSTLPLTCIPLSSLSSFHPLSVRPFCLRVDDSLLGELARMSSKLTEGGGGGGQKAECLIADEKSALETLGLGGESR